MELTIRKARSTGKEKENIQYRIGEKRRKMVNRSRLQTYSLFGKMERIHALTSLVQRIQSIRFNEFNLMCSLCILFVLFFFSSAFTGDRYSVTNWIMVFWLWTNGFFFFFSDPFFQYLISLNVQTAEYASYACILSAMRG